MLSLKTETDIFTNSECPGVLLGTAIGAATGAGVVGALDTTFVATADLGLSHLIFALGGGIFGGIVGAKLS